MVLVIQAGSLQLTISLHKHVRQKQQNAAYTAVLALAGGVNSSQAGAIKTALAQSLTLWQGPPGTGKTSTLVHFMCLATLVLPKGHGASILASAASNVAVDGLVAGLLKQGIAVVRVGQPAKVLPRRAPLSLASKLPVGSSWPLSSFQEKSCL